MSYSTDEGNTWKDVDMDLKEGDAKKGKETARRGTRTATTRSEPNEEKTRVQSAAR